MPRPAARRPARRRPAPDPAGVVPDTRDWRSVVGISEETGFSRAMQAETDAAREAAREDGERPSSTPTT